MSTEQLIKKKEENMISSFSEEIGVFFFSWLAFLSFPFSFFIPKETLILFLQDSPFLSRQFTFKPFNNYFPKKEEIVLHKIFKL